MTFAIGSAASASTVLRDLAAEDPATVPPDAGDIASPLGCANAEIAVGSADRVPDLFAAPRRAD